MIEVLVLFDTVTRKKAQWRLGRESQIELRQRVGRAE